MLSYIGSNPITPNECTDMMKLVNILDLDSKDFNLKGSNPFIRKLISTLMYNKRINKFYIYSFIIH